MEDKDLIRQINDGNINLFDDLMKKYTREMFKYIYNFTSSYENAEDLMQEVFSKAYFSLKKYDSNKSTFRTYLYRIAHNHVVNFLKSKTYKNSMSDVSIEESLFSSNEDIENEIVKDEQIEDILLVIDKVLNKKAKNIILLHFFSSLSVNEIAETFQLPVKYIYHTINYSIKKIRNEVNIDGEIQ